MKLLITSLLFLLPLFAYATDVTTTPLAAADAGTNAIGTPVGPAHVVPPVLPNIEGAWVSNAADASGATQVAIYIHNGGVTEKWSTITPIPCTFYRGYAITNQTVNTVQLAPKYYVTNPVYNVLEDTYAVDNMNDSEAQIATRIYTNTVLLQQVRSYSFTAGNAGSQQLTLGVENPFTHQFSTQTFAYVVTLDPEASGEYSYVVDAKTDHWQSTGIVLTDGTKAEVRVPVLLRKPQADGTPTYQTWGVIYNDHPAKGWSAHRADGHYTGDNTPPNRRFVKTDAREGSLVVRVKDSSYTSAFSKPDEAISTTGAGEIQFIANDESPRNHSDKAWMEDVGHSGFDDNYGKLAVTIVPF